MAFFDRLRGVARATLPAGRAISGTRAQPERIVLGVREGYSPSVKPPVRIFIGTEPAQYRAERVLLWSIEQVRDPARVYEIYLMKDLVGFGRRGWLTGFTNYRFAIPHFAGGYGRAIYNDVDQIYLADPGELFDTDLQGHGFLALSGHDTSVMVLDCARMASVWTLAAAQRQPRKWLEERACAIPGLWGQLEQCWNARDGEYEPGRTKLLHYTTIHMQPWQPFPQRYVYQHHPVAHVWLDLERAADAAGYQVFTAARPSAAYTALRESIAHDGDTARVFGEPLLSAEHWDTVVQSVYELVERSGARSIVHYDFVRQGEERPLAQALRARNNKLDIVCADILGLAGTNHPPLHDGVVCTDALAYVPDEDVPWVLQELFARARRFVCIVGVNDRRAQRSVRGRSLPGWSRDESWWLTQLGTVGVRYPALHWRLVCLTPTRMGRHRMWIQEGGRRLGGPPTVWVLTDEKPGHTSQSIGLAEALGWPYEVKTIRFTSLGLLSSYLLDGSLMGVERARSAALTPPWPDLVIATGRRLAPVARWIKVQSCGRTRLVHLRKGGERAERFDLVVSHVHFRLPPHPRRVETIAPLNPINPRKLAQAAERWREVFRDAPRPRIALLVGGTSATHRWDGEIARRLGEEVRAFARAVGGSLFVTTSPRTGPEATDALHRGLGEVHLFYRWQPGGQENPYLAFLALADVLIVTGESESMLAEAGATGKPLYIYPLPERRLGLWARCQEWLVACAQTPRLNTRGIARPQEGWQYLCARLLERGLIQPRRDLDLLHRALVDRGVARFFGAPLVAACGSPLQEVDRVADRVRVLMGDVEGREEVGRAAGRVG
ncbi:MAG: mitochondrial fission ELM1 family protein [Candidatus Binatia bacterium]|nr:mitochondrial fission ELM1 family protein [Candidatus Binatia bacterium]